MHRSYCTADKVQFSFQTFRDFMFGLIYTFSFVPISANPNIMIPCQLNSLLIWTVKLIVGSYAIFTQGWWCLLSWDNLDFHFQYIEVHDTTEFHATEQSLVRFLPVIFQHTTWMFVCLNNVFTCLDTATRYFSSSHISQNYFKRSLPHMALME